MATEGDQQGLDNFVETEGEVWVAKTELKAGAVGLTGAIMQNVTHIAPAGMKAYEARKEFRSGIYSYEQRPVELVEPYASQFRRNKTAWKFFQAQPPGYRKMMNRTFISSICDRESWSLRRCRKNLKIGVSGSGRGHKTFHRWVPGTG